MLKGGGTLQESSLKPERHVPLPAGQPARGWSKGEGAPVNLVVICAAIKTNVAACTG